MKAACKLASVVVNGWSQAGIWSNGKKEGGRVSRKVEVIERAHYACVVDQII